MELLSVGNIEVFEEDGLPNLICKCCKVILSNAYKFKQVCKRSETLLKTYPVTGVIPKKLVIQQEPLPNAKKEVQEPPKPKDVKSVGTETDRVEVKSTGTECDKKVLKSIGIGSEKIIHKSIGTATAKIPQKSVSVGCKVDSQESQTQTDIETVPIDQMEMIISNEADIPILAPPTLFEDSRPQIISNQKVKILNKAMTDTTPAKQFKKKSTTKHEVTSDSTPTILNSKLKLPQVEHQIIETIEETPDGNIEIIAYEEEYLDEDMVKKSERKIQDKTEDGVVYTCEVCDKGFLLLQQLEIHKENHTRARDHPCEHCDKAFFTKYDLAKHILTHTKQKGGFW